MPAVVKRQDAAHERLLEELTTDIRMLKAAVDDIAHLTRSKREALRAN
jgi:hypothetical protein